MTEEQEAHLAAIKYMAGELIEVKYRKGQLEHGGNLFDQSMLELVDESINEAVDQLVYLLTLRVKLGQDQALGVESRNRWSGGR